MEIIIITLFLDVVDVIFTVVLYIIDRIDARHWHIRRKYQTFLYKFNAFDYFRIWKRKFTLLTYRLEFNYARRIMWGRHIKFLRLYLTCIETRTLMYWYTAGWTSWLCLTLHLYYHAKVRDLGPSYDIFDYNPDIRVSIRRTIGINLLICWTLWTWAWKSTSIAIATFFFKKLFFVRLTWRYWYELTIYSFIEMHVLNYIHNVFETNRTIWYNYNDLQLLSTDFFNHKFNTHFINTTETFINVHTKIFFLWFPWTSFFNIITVFGLVYLLIFLAIYNTDNVYYVVLYTILLVFLFTSTLVSLDLDIFAGLLVLIESVVVLMLFFLIIYLIPNIKNQLKNDKWRLNLMVVLILLFVSNYSYNNLNQTAITPFSLNAIFLDEFYESLQELYINDLTGIYINLYWTNSIILVVIGLLLLIASIICVVLVSFFTKLRNSNLKSFLELFKIVKMSYSLIFIRKQNLSKQGRSVSSTRVFTKKSFNTEAHSEYREKQERFEQQQREKAKQAGATDNSTDTKV